MLSVCMPCAAGTNSGPRTLSYNPAENAVLLTSDVDGGSYELYLIPKDANGASVVSCLFAWKTAGHGMLLKRSSTLYSDYSALGIPALHAR